MRIIEVSNDGKFLEGVLPLVPPSEKIILRACDKGQPNIVANHIEVHGKNYFTME